MNPFAWCFDACDCNSSITANGIRISASFISFFSISSSKSPLIIMLVSGTIYILFSNKYFIDVSIILNYNSNSKYLFALFLLLLTGLIGVF